MLFHLSLIIFLAKSIGILVYNETTSNDTSLKLSFNVTLSTKFLKSKEFLIYIYKNECLSVGWLVRR